MLNEKKSKHFIKQPFFKGGNEAFRRAIYGQLRYPQAALEAGVEGIVMLEYDIDYKGNVVDVRVLQGIGYGCDDEACRVVKLLKFDVPSTRGVRVMFHKKLKVQFKLPVSQPVVAPPQAARQFTYQVVTAPQEKKGDAPEPPTKPVITYRITFG